MTFFEKRRSIVKHPHVLELKNYPTVTVAVPCYNEERTVRKTIESLQALDYPKDKLSIFLIDDGSTDTTWEVFKKFENTNGISIFKKENGGKHTALNLALSKCNTEFFGCLDSDSLVHPQALKRIINMFEGDPKAMSIVPSIIVLDPKNIIQNAQKAEYEMAIYIKKMLGFMGGIHVTPGPFSIFRKKVFDDLGEYRKAHNTEDQEIAFRMQENGYKIDHCNDAYVYTITPSSIFKLYKQRLRWVYGSINNMIDYRRLLFRKKYGTVAFFTIPAGIISIVSVVFVFFMLIYNIGKFVYTKFTQISTVGLSNYHNLNFDWFFFDTKTVFFFSIILYILLVTSVIIGRRMANEKRAISISVVYFIVIYSVLAPLWVLKAIFNSFISKESSWTLERIPSKT
ncbi:MAG: glycosyltransferase family 2 protein [Patescibacteria group bacterium]|nr:glycosyltransferase family 2 protein [Patescibacteria group bacterium]